MSYPGQQQPQYAQPGAPPPGSFAPPVGPPPPMGASYAEPSGPPPPGGGAGAYMPTDYKPPMDSGDSKAGPPGYNNSYPPQPQQAYGQQQQYGQQPYGQAPMQQTPQVIYVQQQPQQQQSSGVNNLAAGAALGCGLCCCLDCLF
ncbi:hypothetical protein HDU78_003454 [Chytriomyces hyalinus]|nr:hypothetical protein HDU78_003454 [Chytriomyces hyalinus]KAJ3263422.1 hypothetical protein HDU77_010716 [Chytriomyces hyalinus]